MHVGVCTNTPVNNVIYMWAYNSILPQIFEYLRQNNNITRHTRFFLIYVRPIYGRYCT